MKRADPDLALVVKALVAIFCAGMVALSCAGCSRSTPPIACAGPLPITCTCVTACDFSETWPVLETSAGLMARDACVPWCTRRDRP